MNNLFYSRVNLLATCAHLLDAAISETDPRYDDYMAVMGTDFFAEAHATAKARDSALGVASPYVEFVTASPQDLNAAEYPLYRMAIGPALGEEGFSQVAEPVLTALVEQYRDFHRDLHGSLTVIIARVEYTVRFTSTSAMPTICMAPVYGSSTTERDERTADWLAGYLFAELGAAAA